MVVVEHQDSSIHLVVAPGQFCTRGCGGEVVTNLVPSVRDYFTEEEYMCVGVCTLY